MADRSSAMATKAVPIPAAFAPWIWVAAGEISGKSRNKLSAIIIAHSFGGWRLFRSLDIDLAMILKIESGRRRDQVAKIRAAVTGTYEKSGLEYIRYNKLFDHLVMMKHFL